MRKYIVFKSSHIISLFTDTFDKWYMRNVYNFHVRKFEKEMKDGAIIPLALVIWVSQ